MLRMSPHSLGATSLTDPSDRIPALWGTSFLAITLWTMGSADKTWLSEKDPWVRQLPAGEPEKETLGRLVEEDHDEAETQYYEGVADPTFLQNETEQRRYRGMMRRRLRRFRSSS